MLLRMDPLLTELYRISPFPRGLIAVERRCKNFDVSRMYSGLQELDTAIHKLHERKLVTVERQHEEIATAPPSPPIRPRGNVITNGSFADWAVSHLATRDIIHVVGSDFAVYAVLGNGASARRT
jgi:hypothetical protein